MSRLMPCVVSWTLAHGVCGVMWYCILNNSGMWRRHLMPKFPMCLVPVTVDPYCLIHMRLTVRCFTGRAYCIWRNMLSFPILLPAAEKAARPVGVTCIATEIAVPNELPTRNRNTANCVHWSACLVKPEASWLIGTPASTVMGSNSTLVAPGHTWACNI